MHTDKKLQCEKIFKALSNSSRLEIVRLLSEHQFCVNALVSRMNISQAAVSQHLKILENAGLVTKKKEGYWIHYTLVPEGFRTGYDFLSKVRQLSNERQLHNKSQEVIEKCVRKRRVNVKGVKTPKPVPPNR